MLTYNEPTTAARRGFFGLAVTSLAFALAFLPAPLVVLYQLNDECLRTTSWGAEHAAWDTLFRIPPAPVARPLDLMVRTAVFGAMLVALFLIATSIATFRSRAAAFRLHALYVPIQVVVMVAVMVAAHRFSAALDLSNDQRNWALELSRESAVRKFAMIVGGLGLLYPFVLALLYWRWKTDDSGMAHAARMTR
jgi:hypothetical protein